MSIIPFACPRASTLIMQLRGIFVDRATASAKSSFSASLLLNAAMSNNELKVLDFSCICRRLAETGSILMWVSSSGSLVGTSVGDPVGEALGVSVVGSGVGSSVGITVGALVVGSGVGSSVGVLVGVRVVGASVVGALVGTLVVGASVVGALVGVAVGDTVAAHVCA
jgi:hypothetical protein